jgi:hypothetical protein
MKTIAQYEHELSELKLEDLRAETPADQLAEAENKLKIIENSLSLELHAMKAQFQGRATSLAGQMSRRSGKARSEEEQRLDSERNTRLNPYQDLLDQMHHWQAKLAELNPEKPVSAPKP